MMHGGLGGGVGIGRFRLGDGPHHRAEIDDVGRLLASRRGEQHRREFAREREEPGHVDAEDPVERLPGEGLVGIAPGHAGVVDEDMQGVRPLARLGRKLRHAGLGRDRSAEALARADRRQLPCRFLAGLGLARGDQHPCARGEQRFGADAAEAGRPAGDERRAAADRKKIRRRKHGCPPEMTIRADPSKPAGKAKLRP